MPDFWHPENETISSGDAADHLKADGWVCIPEAEAKVLNPVFPADYCLYATKPDPIPDNETSVVDADVLANLKYNQLKALERRTLVLEALRTRLAQAGQTYSAVDQLAAAELAQVEARQLELLGG